MLNIDRIVIKHEGRNIPLKIEWIQTSEGPQIEDIEGVVDCIERWQEIEDEVMYRLCRLSALNNINGLAYLAGVTI